MNIQASSIPYVSGLAPLAATNGHGPVLVNRSYWGGPLTIHGVVRIYTDGQRMYDSGTVTNSTPTQHADPDVTGAHILQIDVGDVGDDINFDNADIASRQMTTDL